MKRLLFFIGLCATTLYSSAQLQAPTLNSPADMATVIDVNTKLIWSPSIGGLVFGYEVEVDQDSLFGSPTTTFPVNGTAARTSELDFNSTYYWRARAKGSGSTFSPWSAKRSFTTFNNQFTGRSPTGGNKSLRINLTWDTIAGVDTYYYELAEDINFNSPISGFVPHPFIGVIIDELKFNQKYFYRMWADHNSDVSAKSSVDSFETRNTIVLLDPDNGSTLEHPSTELECTNTPGVTSYKFQIDNSPNFDTNSLEFQVTTVLDIDFDNTDPISWFTSRLLYSDQYYWRVQGLNNTGKSAWSNARSFTTIDMVTLSAPLDGAVNVPDQATFEWKKIDGTETYEIHIDTDPGFSNPFILYMDDDTSTSVKVSFIDFAPTYHWRVRSIHAKDNSAFSDTWSFTVHPVGINESQELTFSVSPNPADDMIQLQLNTLVSGNVQLDFHNSIGKLVSSRTLSNNNSNSVIDVDVSDLKSGVYMMTIKVNKTQTTQRLIIR